MGACGPAGSPPPSAGAGAGSSVPATPSAGTPERAWLDVGGSWFAVVAGTDRARPAYVLDIPPGTLVQVAGYGSLTLQGALAAGGSDLAASAVSGLLGIALAGWSRVSGSSAASVAGGAAVDALPVSPDGTGWSGVRAAPGDVQALVAAHLGGVRLTPERLLGRRVEVDDAAGAPEGARRAMLVLTARGFRVVRQGAAPGGGRGTQVVVYSGSAASLRTAGEVRDALGVGTVIQSPRPEGSRDPGAVVDVTVILGSDFVKQTEGGT